MTAAQQPADWPRLFEQRINVGDLDGALALYTADAHFVPPSGPIVVGHDGIRSMLAEMIASRAHMQCRVAKVVALDDVALVYNDWQGSSVDATGKVVERRGKAIEIVRRQPDGTWRLIVGDPHGRG